MSSEYLNTCLHENTIHVFAYVHCVADLLWPHSLILDFPGWQQRRVKLGQLDATHSISVLMLIGLSTSHAPSQ